MWKVKNNYFAMKTHGCEDIFYIRCFVGGCCWFGCARYYLFWITLLVSFVCYEMISQQAVSVLEGVFTCQEGRVPVAFMQAQDDYCDVASSCKPSISMPKGNFAASTIAKLVACNKMKKKFANYFDAEPTFKQSLSIPEAKVHLRTIAKRAASKNIKKKFAQSYQMSQVQNACKQTAAAKTDLEVQFEQAHEGKEHLRRKKWANTKEQYDEAIKRTPKDPNIDSNRVGAVHELRGHPDSFKDQVGGPTIAELIADIVDEEQETRDLMKDNKEKDLVQFVLSETTKMPNKTAAPAALKKMNQKSPSLRFE